MIGKPAIAYLVQKLFEWLSTIIIDCLISKQLKYLQLHI